MYDKALEQLIDAVIADGIITDQERKVVYKKAASLGIDQDEIEVYLEGRLDTFKNSTTSKSGKHGTLCTCPNCGAVVDSFAGKCSECGHNFVDIEANRTTKQLQVELEKIDKESKTTITGSVLSLWGQDENTQRKIQLIKNFSIPNTKADLIEFGMLCYTNLSAKAVTNAEIELSKAWSAKAKEMEAKATILFPNDRDVNSAFSHLNKERKSFFKSHPRALNAIIGIGILIIIYGGIGIAAAKCSRDAEKYTTEKIEEIKSLPMPDTQNYKECYRLFSDIIWTESKRASEGYESFVQAQKAYGDLLIIAYKEAGVPDNMIPQSLISIVQDQTNENEDSEVTKTDTSKIYQEPLD